MIENLLKFARTDEHDAKTLDLETFVTGVQNSSSSFDTYAAATFKHQYNTNTRLDFFIHRFNELKVIGFDVSADALLLDAKVDMHQKIDHFVGKYYAKGRMNRAYIKNVFDTLRQFVLPPKPTIEQRAYVERLTEVYGDVLKRCQHKDRTFTPEQKICLLIVGVDAHVLCTPDASAKCAEDALTGVKRPTSK